MTKKILSVLAMISIAAMMMLSSCDTVNADNSTNNVNDGLIGKWEYKYERWDGITTNTIEITSDNKFIYYTKHEEDNEIIGSGGATGTIKSVNEKEIIIENLGNVNKIIVEYNILSGTSVEFKCEIFNNDDSFHTYKKVN
ncbi:MAG: hypothetical protein II196_09445 [Spirochaetales bacterium]|nr:hypothetical protein [Spirochaetales bacterium]